MHNYTKEQLYELMVSYKSCSYFVSKHLLKCTLTEDQIKWLETKDPYVVMGGERQTYRTSTMLARGLWRAAFVSNTTVIYLAPNQILTKSALHSVERMIEDLDLLIPEITYKSNSKISFENGSSIFFSRAVHSSVRGMSCNVVLLDNSSALRSAEVEELRESIYPMSCLTFMEAY